MLDSPVLRPLPAAGESGVGSEEAPTSPQWNLTQIGAERVWKEFGITGVFVVASAGNQGAGCSTVASPIALYDESFSVGAVDSNRLLADFSSHGPVTADARGRIKPDIVAPGRTAYNKARNICVFWPDLINNKEKRQPEKVAHRSLPPPPALPPTVWKGG